MYSEANHSTERLVTKKMTAEVMEMMIMMMAMDVNPTWNASSRKIENGPRIILETLMSWMRRSKNS